VVEILLMLFLLMVVSTLCLVVPYAVVKLVRVNHSRNRFWTYLLSIICAFSLFFVPGFLALGPQGLQANDTGRIYLAVIYGNINTSMEQRDVNIGLLETNLPDDMDKEVLYIPQGKDPQFTLKEFLQTYVLPIDKMALKNLPPPEIERSMLDMNDSDPQMPEWNERGPQSQNGHFNVSMRPSSWHGISPIVSPMFHSMGSYDARPLHRPMDAQPGNLMTTDLTTAKVEIINASDKDIFYFPIQVPSEPSEAQMATYKRSNISEPRSDTPQPFNMSEPEPLQHSEKGHFQMFKQKVLVLEDASASISSFGMAGADLEISQMNVTGFYVFILALMSLGSISLLYVLRFNGRNLLRSLGAQPCRDKRILEMVDKICKENGTSISAVYEYSGNANAFVFGYPTKLVISKGLMQCLSREELRTILCHELSHKKNGDLLLKPILFGTRLFFFYNPIVHYVYHKIIKEQELLADSAFLKTTEEKQTFIEALIKVSEHNSSLHSDPRSRDRSTQANLGSGRSPNISERFDNLFADA